MHLLIYTQVVDAKDPILGFFVSWIRVCAEKCDAVTVICLQKGTYELPSHVSVYSLGKEEGKGRCTYGIRLYRYLWRFCIKEQTSYVFFHMGAIANVLAAPFFLLRKIRGTQFCWWKTYGHLNVLERCALLFSDRVYTAVPESFPIETPKRHVVGHAIDTELFTPLSAARKGDRILFVGRISRVKRIEQVIKVAHMLTERGNPIQVRIVGTVADPLYQQELAHLVTNLHLESVVQFVGGMTQHELVGEYQKAIVLINPSDTDGLDKVVLEAMACGVIPITANLSFKTLLSHFSLFVQKNNLDEYLSCTQKVFAMSESERHAMATSLRDIVVREHALSTLPYRLFGLQ